MKKAAKNKEDITEISPKEMLIIYVCMMDKTNPRKPVPQATWNSFSKGAKQLIKKIQDGKTAAAKLDASLPVNTGTEDRDSGQGMEGSRDSQEQPDSEVRHTS